MTGSQQDQDVPGHRGRVAADLTSLIARPSPPLTTRNEKVIGSRPCRAYETPGSGQPVPGQWRSANSRDGRSDADGARRDLAMPRWLPISSNR